MSPILERLIPTKAELDVSHVACPISRPAGWLPRKDVDPRAKATHRFGNPLPEVDLCQTQSSAPEPTPCFGLSTVGIAGER